MLYCELDIYDYEATIIDEMMEGIELNYEPEEPEDDFEADDFDDDVDETFYDPYMGCDWYE